MDGDRAAAHAFYEMMPLIFDGTARTVTLSAWLHDMEAIFRICHIENHLQVPLAARCLARDARSWWRSIGEPALLGGSWEEFRVLIIGRYGPIPDADAAMPYRDETIYDNMNFERYLNFIVDWHAYQNESMSHYCRRFQEAMLPHIPRIGNPEFRALQIIREGVPPGIRAHVPLPVVGMTLEEMIDRIMEAEVTHHLQQVEALQQPNEVVPANGGPVWHEEEPINAVPLQVIPPPEDGVGMEAQDEEQLDPPINQNPLEDDEEEDIWGEEEEETEDDEEDPEEFPLDEEDLDVFSDAASN